MKIKAIKKNETGTVEGIILSLEEKTNKNNGIFVNIGISDGETQIVARRWNTRLDEFPYKKGQAVLMDIKAEDYNGSLSYVVREMTESSADPGQFICGAPVKPEDMFSFLLKTGKRCGVYAVIVTKILTAYKDKLMTWGAGKNVHHNIKSGLLYHTYRMTKTAAYITSVYNKEPAMLKNCRDINTELLVAGTILHDIGKLWELETDSLGVSEYTPKGTMLGHAFIGAELVGRVGCEEKVDEENIMLLQHMILAHHGKYEYQAVSLPAIPEAMILHNIDMIDSEMYQFEVQANELEPGTMSARVFGLEQKVYRPTWRVPVEKTEN